MNCVYWIHHKEHNDIFTQGYVGISSDFSARLRNHKTKPSNKHMQNVINKYGWDSLVKEKILIADTDYCLMIETKLRPNDFIGWNQTKGGGVPPRPKKGMGQGRKMPEETKLKLSIARKGKKHSMETRKKLSDLAHAQWARQKNTPLPADS